MAAKSKFKINPVFKADMKKLKRGILTAAEEGMGAAIEMAEAEAQEKARWAAVGENFYKSVHPYYGETTWEWTVTGMSRAALAGYVASKGKRPALPTISMPDTYVYIDGRQLGGPRSHTAVPPKAQTAQLNIVRGVLTGYGPYRGALQAKEREGSGVARGFSKATSGHHMSAGDPIEKETMNRWRTFFVPAFLVPRMKAEMAKAIASLG